MLSFCHIDRVQRVESQRIIMLQPFPRLYRQNSQPYNVLTSHLTPLRSILCYPGHSPSSNNFLQLHSHLLILPLPPPPSLHSSLTHSLPPFPILPFSYLSFPSLSLPLPLSFPSSLPPCISLRLFLCPSLPSPQSTYPLLLNPQPDLPPPLLPHPLLHPPPLYPLLSVVPPPSSTLLPSTPLLSPKISVQDIHPVEFGQSSPIHMNSSRIT